MTLTQNTVQWKAFQVNPHCSLYVCTNHHVLYSTHHIQHIPHMSFRILNVCFPKHQIWMFLSECHVFCWFSHCQAHSWLGTSNKYKHWFLLRHLGYAVRKNEASVIMFSILGRTSSHAHLTTTPTDRPFVTQGGGNAFVTSVGGNPHCLTSGQHAHLGKPWPSNSS